MTKIFDESALSVLPLPNGFIIAFCKSGDDESGKMVVAYNLVSFEKEDVSSVTRSVYQLAKFGQCYKLIVSQLPNTFYWNTAALPNDRILTYYPDGSAKIFDTEARVCWTGSITYNGKGPADIVCQGDIMWVSFPEGNCVARFNLRTMREELRIGGEASAFSSPEGLLLEGTRLYVCSSQNGKIFEINTENFAVSEHLKFDEPVHQYLRVNGFNTVRLDSGIYKI